ncbi:MAG: rRNA adenine methyltransferase [Spirochaetaceae bacterium]|nr:rRNA adenine methyltransferase [Spirochaetaceae bacterium]|tara:strand:+ start:3600 stop:4223 length:624 start_codon:yes stop_codon:yes gene_type:complete
MRDEGTIKFKADFELCHPFSAPVVTSLIAARNRLFDRGLIGVYPDGISFGNLSIRAHHPEDARPGFFITGTQTGYIQRLDETHIAFVDRCDIAANYLRSTGPIQASSEAMTHYMIYSVDPAINAVVHVHSPVMWKYWKDRAPTTGRDIPYGTPEMAAAVEDLVLVRKPEQAAGFLVMAGHEDGVMSYGLNLDVAMELILEKAEEAGV